MPGIPPKLNTLWRFNVNSVSHFIRQHHIIVVQVVLITCFAGHVSLEPCMSLQHVTFFCEENYGFIFISAYLSSTYVVISSSLIFHSFVRIFLPKIFSRQWWCVRAVSTPSATWRYVRSIRTPSAACGFQTSNVCLQLAQYSFALEETYSALSLCHLLKVVTAWSSCARSYRSLGSVVTVNK